MPTEVRADPPSDAGRTPTRDATIGEWIDRLAQRGGDPGGGAAAAVMLAMAGSLIAMVAKYAAESGVERRARALSRAALDRADADAAASAAFGAALRSGDERERDDAALAAARSSAALAALARDAIGDVERIAGRVEPTLLADVVAAASALRAALGAARANLRGDLGALSGHGRPGGSVRRAHPDLWTAAQACEEVIARLDELTRRIDTRTAGID